MQKFKWQQIDEKEWDAIVPPPAKTKESPWDEMIQALIDGSIVSLPIEDEKDVKGIRIGLARRASSAFGVTLNFRYDAGRNVLAVRLGGEKQEKPATTSGEKRPVGRPKKNA